MGDLSSLIEVIQGLSLAGVGVLVIVFGVTEVVKRLFNLDGKAVEILAVALGFLFTGVAYGNSSELIPAEIMVYINWFFIAIMGSVAAMGMYKFIGGKVTEILAAFASKKET